MKKRILTLLLLSVFLLAAALPASAASNDSLEPIKTFVSGEEYVLAAPGINDYKGPFGEACLVAKEAKAHGMDYATRPSKLSQARDCLWEITLNADGTCTLYSNDAKKYLNMKANEAYLSDNAQNLNANISGNKITLSVKDGGETYYLRFTNMYTTYSCWHAGTATSSNVFTMYSTKQTVEFKEYDNGGQTPLFSVACFADLHVDYGIQSWDIPIREGTINAVNKLKELGGADVVLIGGDILSQNDQGAAWDEDIIKLAMDTVYETLMEGSTEWLVLPVTGNHDSEAGNAAGGTVYSGNWDPYMEEWVGEFDAVLKNTASPFNETLGYRYNINGIDFIGINTPYLSSRSSGLLASQAVWLEKQLEEIGKDKTVIVTTHYPVLHAKYPMGTLNSGDARAAFEAVLKKYPNVLYCYGHVHEGDADYAWYSASELIVPSGTSVPNSDNSYTTTGYINCHMGSMGYYNNQFQPGGLQAAEPQIVQFMKMDFYADHITFNFYNTGERSGDPDVYEIASYTVRRNMAEQLGAEAPDSSNTEAPTDVPSTDSAVDSVTGPEASAPATDAGTEGTGGSILWIVLILCGTVVVGGGVVILLVLKKK